MEINLFDMFRTNTLRDRQTALLVIKEVSKIPPSNSVTINFEKIIFASRSFCHELLTNLKDRKNVTFQNMDETIRKMMVIVRVRAKKPIADLDIPTKVMVIA